MSCEVAFCTQPGLEFNPVMTLDGQTTDEYGSYTFPPPTPGAAPFSIAGQGLVYLNVTYDGAFLF